MRKLISFTFVFFASLFLFVLGVSNFKVNADSQINTYLEQQENDSTGNETKIRFICTIENVSDLNSISKITFNFYLYNYISTGSYSENGTYTTTTVYDSVEGTNGKNKIDNTYYAVFTLTGVDKFKDYTLSTSVTLDTNVGDITTNEVTHTIQDSGDTFFKGMDSSAVPALEAAGVTYKNDNGDVEDVFKVLADHGVNYIRVRVWNDPYYTDSNNVKYSYGGGNCDLANAIAIGKRANKYGMKLLVDFHYSDFWADPEKQKLPKAWEGYSDSQIVTAIYDFTYASLTEMKDAGIDVGMVQVGNETNDALCGHMGDSNMSAICSFFNSGSSAVRAVYPSALVAVHFANPSNYSDYQWYASELNKYSVDYDVFGTSYYPYWHGSLNNLSKLLSEIADTYNKDVCVLETAYANTEEYTDSRSDGYNNTVFTREQELADNTNSSLPYEFTVDGQKNAVINLMDTIKNKTTNGLGVFYWEGTWIKTPSSSASITNSYSNDSEVYGTGWGNKYAYYYDSANYKLENGGCAIENEAFFDENGNPFDSLNAFKVDVSSAITRSTDGYASATLCNSSFEDESLDGWVLRSSVDGTWPKKDYKNDGSYGLSFGSSSSYTLDLYQDISYITYGTYSFSLDVMGNILSSNIYIYVSINGVKTTVSAPLAGWDSWKTYTVTFSATLEDTVEVGFYVSASGIWGYIDNAKLERVDSSSGTDVSFVNDIEDSTFDSYSSWTITQNVAVTPSIKTDSNATNNTTPLLNMWGGNDIGLDFSISQDVSGNNGTASFSIEISSGSYSGCEIYAYISVNGNVTKGQTVTATNGWDVWQTISVSNVSVKDTDTVIVGLYVKISDNNSWIYIDNATLSIS
ncbi:arabinogalactan endo-1,4-beta-galactosidase [Anaeroplasma bactoclasticum]|jgi:arabinogalactan endo-1,4-beta-galactosidase|uniref:Arabinogalactan endo-beta-1,4-galactanase n=1 Tax=Anaeroplasma bactoclasticum TaxID=2088 RepID=A0A397S0W6_9MOLU|nr:glycosyl hydrolase 53 family protein [Anaeroplasma bactoclasticum]RIA75834.1 arabinogalactan endo-1,4-beta-galactosidase [Anaeroplasma bactoclasticum]